MVIIDGKGIKNNYNIYISEGFEDFYYALDSEAGRNCKVYIITDDVVAGIYSELIAEIKGRYSAFVYSMRHGEENKNINTIMDIYKFLLENKADRSSIIVALGGGVVGDLAGFAAATFMRGIKLVNVPTTLIAQVDSSVGGKTGYNFMGIKNIIGCFNDPAFVYVSTLFLKSLDTIEFNSGMGEIIKYGLIRNEVLLKLIEENIEKLKACSSEVLEIIVKGCLEIKCEVVNEDYEDMGLRNILNFGHTIGHGLEAASDYKLHHGIAVALGMLSALKLSERKFKTDSEIYSRVQRIYEYLGIPARYKVDNFNSFMYAIKHDKKNNKAINFVLLKEIGSCEVKVPVTEEEILWALKNSIIEEAF